MARKTNDPRPRDHTDAAKDVARELAGVAGQLAQLKGEAMNWFEDKAGSVRVPALLLALIGQRRALPR